MPPILVCSNANIQVTKDQSDSNLISYYFYFLRLQDQNYTENPLPVYPVLKAIIVRGSGVCV